MQKRVALTINYRKRKNTSPWGMTYEEYTRQGAD